MAQNHLPIEEFDNCKNKMTAIRRSTFFARKVHKFKKMLRVLLKRGDEYTQRTPEEIQNAINEALEERLKEDIIESGGICGDAIQSVVDGSISLLAVHPGQTVSLPVHFLCTAPGKFAWTFLPPADNDICSVGDTTPITSAQSPQRQSPVLLRQQ
ncbi:enhancer of split m4, Bearded family member [Lycorma delicatula]|uniref:enhancer of split m4, Bearded family member n=1 Tax=Lycorma delicatula TaxID=130591 RepID=UPI003F514547